MRGRNSNSTVPVSESCTHGSNGSFASLPGDEEDDEQQRTDAKPAQVKRRQSVFSKLGSGRLKKVSFRLIFFLVIRYHLTRFNAVLALCG